MKTKNFSKETLEINSSDLVINNPCLTGLFEKHNVEYCCKGNIPLKNSLKELKIPEQEFLEKMNETVQLNKQNLNYPNTSNPIHVINYIIEVYHKPLPNLLDELGRLISKAADHHGAQKPYTITLNKLFIALQEDLTTHLWKEENILFPMIQELYLAKINNKPKPLFHCGNIGNPISQMEYEHDTVGALLHKMEETIAPHQLTETGCTTLKSIKKLFEHLKLEIHKHVHMENYILHPLSRALED